MRASFTMFIPDRYGSVSGERWRTTRSMKSYTWSPIFWNTSVKIVWKMAFVALHQPFELVLVELRGAPLVDRGKGHRGRPRAGIVAVLRFVARGTAKHRLLARLAELAGGVIGIGAGARGVRRLPQITDTSRTRSCPGSAGRRCRGGSCRSARRPTSCPSPSASR